MRSRRVLDSDFKGQPMITEHQLSEYERPSDAGVNQEAEDWLPTTVWEDKNVVEPSDDLDTRRDLAHHVVNDATRETVKCSPDQRKRSERMILQLNFRRAWVPDGVMADVSAAAIKHERPEPAKDQDFKPLHWFAVASRQSPDSQSTHKDVEQIMAVAWDAMLNPEPEAQERRGEPWNRWVEPMKNAEITRRHIHGLRHGFPTRMDMQKMHTLQDRVEFWDRANRAK